MRDSLAAEATGSWHSFTLRSMSEPTVPLLRQAARLCGATVAWNLAVGGAAVATALVTSSLSLIGFGINAVVDSSVSSLLVWRFRSEERGHAERAMRLERSAVRVAGAAFTIIALYLTVRAVVALANREHASSSLFGIAEALGSLVVLPYLAVRKYRLSVRLGSRALRADSLLTVSGVALASIALVGLILQRAAGWWWADPVAALVIAVFLAVQGAGALREAPEASIRHTPSP
jgi:divalent metal cation (Fe/Co/Zn/Cd) transporter